jgi:hypothetical protein
MHRFEGWIPARVYWHQGQPLVDWCWLGELQLSAPFFEQTILQALSHPANLLFRRQTSMEALEDLAASRPGLSPAGFIFHMSRCGSTLLSQMLAALPQNVVLSEAGPIDSILRAHLKNEDITEAQRIRWLRVMVSALGRRRRPEQRHLFIKFDSWHTLFLPLIRLAFPTVPRLFLYREPIEVLVSQHNQRGPQMIPGVLEPALFGWDALVVQQMPFEDYGGCVLAKICEAALQGLAEGNEKLVDYRQLPAIVWPKLMEFLGISCRPDEVHQMVAVSRLNAKNPALSFEPDTLQKNQGASDELREIARRRLDAVYRKLEDQRSRLGFA